jgi:two-component system, OmpR family, phosphate regulon response regulator PhoB
MKDPMAKTILVIDDEPDIRAYLIAVLEDCGYMAFSLAGEEALESIVAQNKPDLILLDIMMPHRSGIGVYKELRSMPGFQQIPIVLISGLEFGAGFPDTFIKDEELPPPDGLIEKPVKIPALVQMVATLLLR